MKPPLPSPTPSPAPTPRAASTLAPTDERWRAEVLGRARAGALDEAAGGTSAEARALALAEELAAEALEPVRDLLPEGAYDELLAELVLHAMADGAVSELLASLLPGVLQGSHERVRGSAEPVASPAEGERKGGAR